MKNETCWWMFIERGTQVEIRKVQSVSEGLKEKARLKRESPGLVVRMEARRA